MAAFSSGATGSRAGNVASDPTFDVRHAAYDPALGSYEGSIDVAGHPLQISVSDEDVTDPEALNERARRAIAYVIGQEEAIFARVVAELFDLKNESWLDDEQPLTEAEFRSALSLVAVEIGPLGNLEIVVGDRGMFWGHEIVVRTDPAGNIWRVGIEG
jgi:hypothetical protein